MLRATPSQASQVCTTAGNQPVQRDVPNPRSIARTMGGGMSSGCSWRCILRLGIECYSVSFRYSKLYLLAWGRWREDLLSARVRNELHWRESAGWHVVIQDGLLPRTPCSCWIAERPLRCCDGVWSLRKFQGAGGSKTSLRPVICKGSNGVIYTAERTLGVRASVHVCACVRPV